MAKIKRICKRCEKEFEIEKSQFENKRGGIYCSRECFRLYSTENKISESVKKARIAKYDKEYKARNKELVKKKKAEYHKRTYDPEKAKQYREKNKEKIQAYKKEYYAKPENKQRRFKYDRKRRCEKKYGPFWESASILIDLEKEINEKMDHYEKFTNRGFFEKQQIRHQGRKR